MSQFDKTILRIKTGQGSVTYLDIKHVLGKLGYTEQNQGKTSGSRLAFYNADLEHIIRLHKPHPVNELKKYQVKLLKEELEDNLLI